MEKIVEKCGDFDFETLILKNGRDICGRCRGLGLGLAIRSLV